MKNHQTKVRSRPEGAIGSVSVPWDTKPGMWVVLVSGVPVIMRDRTVQWRKLFSFRLISSLEHLNWF